MANPNGFILKFKQVPSGKNNLSQVLRMCWLLSVFLFIAMVSIHQNHLWELFKNQAIQKLANYTDLWSASVRDLFPVMCFCIPSREDKMEFPEEKFHMVRVNYIEKALAFKFKLITISCRLDSYWAIL